MILAAGGERAAAGAVEDGLSRARGVVPDQGRDQGVRAVADVGVDRDGQVPRRAQ